MPKLLIIFFFFCLFNLVSDVNRENNNFFFFCLFNLVSDVNREKDDVQHIPCNKVFEKKM